LDKSKDASQYFNRIESPEHVMIAKRRYETILKYLDGHRD